MTTCPKPEPRAPQKARSDRVSREARARCVLAVFAREFGRCESCDRSVLHKNNPHATPFNLGHVHEDPPRSLGGDPTDPNQAHLLCASCHAQAHGLKVKT